MPAPKKNARGSSKAVAPERKIAPMFGALSIDTIDDPLVKAMSAAMKPGSRSAIYAAFKQSGIEVLSWPYGVNPQELAILGDEDSTHSACCAIKATATSRAGYRFVYDSGGSGRQAPRALLDDFDALHDSDGAEEMIYRCERDFWALGNWWIEVVRAVTGRITALNHIPAFTMFCLAPKDAPRIGDYMQEVDGVRVYFRDFGSDPDDYRPDADGNPPNEVIHGIDYTSSHVFYGVPRIWSALNAVLCNRLIGDNNIEFYEDKGVARYILVMDNAYQPDERDVQTITHSVNGLLDRKGNKVVLFGTPGTDVRSRLHKIRDEFNFTDQNVLRNANRDEICRAHDVPPRLIGIISAGSLGGTGEGEVQFDEFKALTIRPRQAVWRRLYDRVFFDTVAKRSKWSLQFNELDFSDMLRLAQAQAQKVRTGILSINEARTENGRESIGPAGDAHFIISGGQPVMVEDIVRPPTPAETAREPVPGKPVIPAKRPEGIDADSDGIIEE